MQNAVKSNVSTIERRRTYDTAFNVKCDADSVADTVVQCADRIGPTYLNDNVSVSGDSELHCGFKTPLKVHSKSFPLLSLRTRCLAPQTNHRQKDDRKEHDCK